MGWFHLNDCRIAPNAPSITFCSHGGPGNALIINYLLTLWRALKIEGVNSFTYLIIIVWPVSPIVTAPCHVISVDWQWVTEIWTESDPRHRPTSWRASVCHCGEFSRVSNGGVCFVCFKAPYTDRENVKNENIAGITIQEESTETSR